MKRFMLAYNSPRYECIIMTQVELQDNEFVTDSLVRKLLESEGEAPEDINEIATYCNYEVKEIK